MFYVYCEAAGERALLTTACDFISAQFFAVKYSLARAGTIAIYPAATGFAREPLMARTAARPRKHRRRVRPLPPAPPQIPPGTCDFRACYETFAHLVR